MSQNEMAAEHALLLSYLLPTPRFICQRYELRSAWLWSLYYVFRWARILGDTPLTCYRATRAQKGWY
jgi:hypothetical protein